MTSFERLFLIQMLIAGNVAAASFIWGNESIKSSILPWSIAWMGTLMFLTQVTNRDGTSKEVFSQNDIGHIIFPIMCAMGGVFFAGVAAIPLIIVAWLIGAF